MSASQPTGNRPTVLGVVRTNNPHVVSIFDAMYEQPDIDFTACVCEPPKSDRAALGWKEADEDQAYLQPWRSAEHRSRYHELAQSADIVIWPGLKHPQGLRLIYKRLLRGKLNILMSERFVLFRKRPWYRYIGIRLTIGMCNSRNVHLFAVGNTAHLDYRRFGATRWKAWQFGYAVEPIPVIDHDLCPAPDGVLRLLFVGSLIKLKAVDVMLQALGAPTLAQKAWTLTIAGDGPERQPLETLAAKLGIIHKVDFKGVVHCDSMNDVYAQADVLIMPSRSDGWGAVVNEAMEHGLAVVAGSGVGAAHILLREGIDGFIFPNEDVDALTNCVGRLLDEPELCASIRRESRQQINRFRPAEFAKRAAALCRGLTGYGPMPEYQEGLCRELS